MYSNLESTLPAPRLAVAAGLLLLAHTAVADCGATMRSMNWDGRASGSYSDADANADFSPYNFLKNIDRASISSVDGAEYLDISLQSGCWGTSSSNGCGMYGRMPLNDRIQATTATMEYVVRFGAGFDWVRGGKLPGMCAGKCPTGCGSVGSNDGFSMRPMWTDNECGGSPEGCVKGESGGMHLYNYYNGFEPAYGCGEELTFQDGDKAIVIEADTDYTVRVVVSMNSAGESNGYMKAYLDGDLVAEKSGLRLSGDGEPMKYLMFDNFFGGSSDMAASKNENLLFKSLNVWEGDCGASGASSGDAPATPATPGARGFVTEAASPTPPAGFVPYTLDETSFNGDGTMETVDFRLDTIFNGGFCAKFASENTGSETCDNFAVELALDPAVFDLQKHTSSLSMLSEDTSKGWYLFGRSGSLNKETSPGTARVGQFCATSKVKALYTESQIMDGVSVTSICNGEDMGTDPQPVS